MSVPLSACVDRRDAHFNLLRMVAASAVLFSHCFALTAGTGDVEPFKAALGLSLGSMAVDVFFVTSGFLVCGSLLARQDLRAFARSRALRIFPALAVATPLTLLVIGLGFTTLPAAAFLRDSGTWLFVVKDLSLLFGVRTRLPGVFEQLPYPVLVNGSLWTLPYEIRLYLGLGLLWWAGRAWGGRHAAAVFRAAVLTIALGAMAAFLLLLDGEQASLRFTALFATGASFYLLRERVPMSWPLWAACALALGLSTLHRDAFFVVYHLVLAYLTLGLAYAPARRLLQYNRLGDYSYGVYIYAFPVQQALIALRPSISAWALLPLAGALSLLLAVLSWHLVEKVALDHKAARPAPAGALNAR